MPVWDTANRLRRRRSKKHFRFLASHDASAGGNSIQTLEEMGEEGFGKEREVSKIMTVFTKLDCVVETEVEGCDGQTRGGASEQDTKGETESSRGLCPIVPVSIGAVSEDQRHTAATENQDVSQNTTNISAEPPNREEAKENRTNSVTPESRQDNSKCKSK